MPGSGWRDQLAKYITPDIQARVDALEAEDEQQDVCERCGLPITREDT